MSSFETKICAELIKKEYANAVSARAGKTFPVKYLVKEKYFPFIDAIAEELQEHKLARLFIEAQFSKFPLFWCQSHFKRNYPPANVVFRGNCMGRYLEYLSEGVREPIQ